MFAFSNCSAGRSWADPEGGDWGDRPKTYEKYNFIHHDFVQLGKQHSRYKAIVSSIALPH